jgi:Flp pilus assembly protein TadB
MTTRMLLGATLGAASAAGLLLLITGWRGTDAPTTDRPRRDLPWTAILTGAAVALLVLVLTRWIAVAAALGLLAGGWQRIFGGTRQTTAAIARLEALAGWTESMRDMVATGLALPEALAATGSTASPLLAEPLGALSDRLHAREPVETALRAFADDLDDVSADLVVAALLLTSRAHGRQLTAVLTALATSARAELTVRRTIQADRRATRRGVQIVLAVTVAMALGLNVLNPGYVAPYRSASGQLALAVVVAVFAIGFGWLHRLSQLPQPDRLLSRAPSPTAAGSVPVTARSVPAAGAHRDWAVSR